VLRFAVPIVFPTGLPDSIRSARIVAIIPARYQSSRLPGKPLEEIAGRPMIEHVYRRASEASSVDAVLVATDDDRIAAAVSAFGGTVVMTQPTHLSGTDRLAEVAAHLGSDIVVNVQGDEPLIAPTAIDAAARRLVDHPADLISTLRRRLTDPSELANPAVVKLVLDADGYALYFSRAAIPFTRPGHPSAPVWKHPGLYAYRREFLLRLAALPPSPLELTEGLEQLRVLEHGYRIATVETTADSIGVDTQEDLERVRRLFEPGVSMS
jgi:3-deoxy-manno-octulosonate cytidylyltransferase (CMP-KDO synthetase)